jgi:peptide/nickel transport system substrate-binding protein
LTIYQTVTTAYKKEARRLLAEAGFPKGFKTPISTTNGYGPDLLDVVQLVQRYLKDVGIEAEMKVQEYGAYMATTFLGKYKGMAMGPLSIAQPINWALIRQQYETI